MQVHDKIVRGRGVGSLGILVLTNVYLLLYCNYDFRHTI